MEYLILAHPDDETALRTAALLRRRHSREAVEIVSAEALAMAPRIVHSLIPDLARSDLAIESVFSLASGVELRSGEIRAVFNRLRSSDAPHFNTATPADREYASAETGALWVSWLASMQSPCTAVINPVWRGALQIGFSQLEWLKLAAQSGLCVSEMQVKPVAETPETRAGPPRVVQRWLAAGRRLLVMDPPAGPSPAGDPGWRVFDEHAAAQLPEFFPGLAEKIIALQSSTACALLELAFTISVNPRGGACEDYRLASVNSFPYLTDSAAILAVAQMLEEAAQ